MVRDVEAVRPGGALEGLAGFYVVDGAGVVIYGVGPPYPLGGWTYRWDGRQVIDNPQTLAVQVFDAAWQFRISGYDLTLP